MTWLRLWIGIGFGLGSDFQVVRDGLRVTVRGRVAASKARAIRQFVRDDLNEATRFAIAGTFGPGRSIRLRWAGTIDPPTRQRVRNVLVELLK